MRFRLRHEIGCTFTRPIRNVVALLRLWPRSHEGQHVTDWWIDADMDCGLKSRDDEFGNLTHTFSAPGPIGTLSITASGNIDTFDTAGVIRASAERLPAEIFLRDTELTAAGEAFRDFVHDATLGEAGDLGRLHAVMEAVHRRLALDSGEGALSAVEAFDRRSGGRGSHAHAFIAASRLLGIPCRFVSGYLLRESSGDAALHAWAEAYVTDLGWTGFDPTNNLCPQGEHVRCAVGFDALGAAFVRGSFPDGLAHSFKVSALG